jgi:hypothetical protein
MSAWVEIAVQLLNGLIGLGATRDRDQIKRRQAEMRHVQAEKKLQELIKRNKQFEAERHDSHT